MFWYLIFNVCVSCELLDEGFPKSPCKLMKVYITTFDSNDFTEIDINYTIFRNLEQLVKITTLSVEIKITFSLLIFDFTL